MSGTQGSDRSCVGGGCALAPASVALDGDECVRDPITPTIAELCTHRHIEFGVLLALWQPSHRTLASVALNADECVRVPIIASCARVELGELDVAATVPVSLGSDDRRAVHASHREPRCTWRCRNRARALASVTLEGDECVRVPIIASCARIALASPRRALGELGELGVAATEPVSLGPDDRLMIAELCTHRFESLVVLGIVATEPEPLRVDLRVWRLTEMSVSGL